MAIWGCGPVGQFAIRSALMLGAGRVIAIDEVPERLAMAEAGGAETIDFSKTDVYDELMERTTSVVRTAASMRSDARRPATARPMPCSTRSRRRPSWPPTGCTCCARRSCAAARRARFRSRASMSVWATRFRLGAAMNKGLTIRLGQTHVQAYTKPLLERIEAGEIDPSFVVTHPASLEDAPAMYKKFRDKEDGVIKVVLRPGN